MPLSPKAFFQSSKENVTAHARTVEALTSTRAAEVALLEYQCGMTSSDGSAAAANQFRLEGARHVLNVLLALHESPQKPQPRPSHNLTPI
jgi:hypothetical protein